jgi:hypothetical protein
MMAAMKFRHELSYDAPPDVEHTVDMAWLKEH